MNAPQRIALIVSLLSFAIAAALWESAPDAFPHAWLAAFVAWIGVPLGCMALMLIHALTGGEWGDALRPQLLAGARSLVLLGLFLIPLLLTAPSLYPWLNISREELPNAFYLDKTFASGRLALYLAVWFGLDWFMLSTARRGAPLAPVAPAGLIALALTASFMSFDAVMSLDPRFASSVFGLLRMAEMGLLALSASILAALGHGLAGVALRQLGRLLLALVILWAYLDFMQFLIVWQSNLPNEAAWYRPRLSGGWGELAAAIALTHFILPFFALLSPKWQTSRNVMAAITALLIIAAGARSFWLVGPEAKAISFLLAGVFAAAAVGMFAATACFTLKTPVIESVRHERENA